MIGFTPQQVDAMSFWQFAACIEGYNKANHPSDPPPPSNADLDAFELRYERHLSKMVH